MSLGIFGDSNYLRKNCDILYQNLRSIISLKTGLEIPNVKSRQHPSSYTIMRRLIDTAFSQLVKSGKIENADDLKKFSKQFNKIETKKIFI